MSRQLFSKFHLSVFLSGALLASDCDLGLEVTTCMPCVVRSIDVCPGEHVTAGQALFSFESMKMVHTVTAQREGYVGAIPVEVNATLPSGYELTRLYNTPPRFEAPSVAPCEFILEEPPQAAEPLAATLEAPASAVVLLETPREEVPVALAPYVPAQVCNDVVCAAPPQEDPQLAHMEDMIGEDDVHEMPASFDVTPPDAPQPVSPKHIPWHEGTVTSAAAVVSTLLDLAMPIPMTPDLKSFGFAFSVHQKRSSFQMTSPLYLGELGTVQTLQNVGHAAQLANGKVQALVFESEILHTRKHPWAAMPLEGGIVVFPNASATQILRTSWRSMTGMFTTPLGFLVLLLTLSLPFLPAPPVGRVFLPLRAR